MKQILAVSWAGGLISGLGSLQLVDTSHFYNIFKKFTFSTPCSTEKKKIKLKLCEKVELLSSAQLLE